MRDSEWFARIGKKLEVKELASQTCEAFFLIQRVLDATPDLHLSRHPNNVLAELVQHDLVRREDLERARIKVGKVGQSVEDLQESAYVELELLQGSLSQNEKMHNKVMQSKLRVLREYVDNALFDFRRFRVLPKGIEKSTLRRTTNGPVAGSPRRDPIGTQVGPVTQRGDPIDPRIIAIVNTYNSLNAEKFRQEYNTVRLSLPQLATRMEAADGNVVLKQGDTGDFLGISMRHEELFVAPRFDLSYTSDAHGPGGFGDVFEVRGFSPGARYRRVILLRPAEFVRFEDKVWQLRRKGAIEVRSA